MKHLPKILSSLVIATFAGVLIAHATETSYLPLAALPISGNSTLPESYTLSTYLSGAIKLLIALGAAFSILIAIIGGTQYVASGIAPSAKQDAKNRIANALIGLALVLTSYLLLNSINPELVSGGFTLPPIESVATVSETCPISPLDALTGQALNMENFAHVIYISDDSSVQQNLTALKKEVAKLSLEVGNTLPLDTFVTSAYRPMAYQRHLYDIVDKWISQGLKDNTDKACEARKDSIREEYIKHDLGTVVARPSCFATHVTGMGVDFQITGTEPDLKIGNQLLSGINAFMVTKHINLKWSALENDPVHFVLQNPPFSGCAASY